jgi:hypothetical protein
MMGRCACRNILWMSLFTNSVTTRCASKKRRPKNKKKGKNEKRAREEQREWRSRRRRLPSSDKKMTSSRTKKRDSATEKKTTSTTTKYKVGEMKYVSNFKDIFASFLFSSSVLVESSHEVFKTFEKKNSRELKWWRTRPFYIGKVNEPKITHTQLSLYSDLKWIQSRLFLYYLNRQGPDEISVVDVYKYLTVVEDR